MVSIIIPMYNVEKYIGRCIESVIKQNVESVDVECIIVDDCSSDMSYEIASHLIDNYEGNVQFRLMKNETNCGVSVTRSKGILHSKGDFIVFLDSDDILKPECISTLLNGHIAHPEADLIIGNVYENGRNQVQYNVESPVFIDNGTDARRWMLKEKKCFSWNKLIRRELLISNQLLFTPNIIFEDILWTYQLYAKVSSIYILPDVTYVYEYNDNSISKSLQKADLLIKSFTTVSMEMLKDDYEEELFVQQHMFILWALMNAVDIAGRTNISRQSSELLSQAKNKLMLKSLGHFRFVLAFYFVIMYWPFYHITKLRIFRRYYLSISRVVEKIALLFNCLHFI